MFFATKLPTIKFESAKLIKVECSIFLKFKFSTSKLIPTPRQIVELKIYEIFIKDIFISRNLISNKVVSFNSLIVMLEIFPDEYKILIILYGMAKSTISSTVFPYYF